MLIEIQKWNYTNSELSFPNEQNVWLWVCECMCVYVCGGDIMSKIMSKSDKFS